VAICFCWTILLLLVETLLVQESAFASGETDCVNYAVAFGAPLAQRFDSVYLDDVVIGRVERQESTSEGRTEAFVCIDRAYKKYMEQGTVAYLSDNKLNIYNVWGSGEPLAAQSRIEGFPSKFALYIHELKSLARLFLRFLH